MKYDLTPAWIDSPTSHNSSHLTRLFIYFFKSNCW